MRMKIFNSKGQQISSTKLQKKKLPKPKERDAHENTRSLQNSKQTGPEKNSSQHIIIRKTNAPNKVRILKAVREKGQVTYKDKPIKITPDFSPETMKARRAWTDIIQTLREHKCQPRLLYTAKLSMTVDGENKVFRDRTKFTCYLSMNPALQRIIIEKTKKQKTKPNKQTKKQYKHGWHTLEKARK